MPLMGSLYVGSSGLQTGQNALNTTTHNLTNIDTVGYVRQQVLLGNKEYNNVGNCDVGLNQVGLGVTYEKVRQVRDFFLDQTYREEAGRSAFYETSYDVINEIETLFGEMEGVAFQNALNDLWVAVQELKKDPSGAVNQGLLVSKANAFLERANAVYSGLISYQNNLNAQVKGNVDLINKYGKQILELNDKITKEELGSEEANDLRDVRNQALDDLAALVNISYFENADGIVTVSIEGSSFVARDCVYEMGVVMADETGYYTPVWPQSSDAPVFNMSLPIDSSYDTDIGKLKALVLTRGEYAANYSDLDGDYDQLSKSTIMNIQAEFDNLIHGVTTAINNVLCEEVNPDSNTYYATAEECPIELFVRLGTPRYNYKEAWTDADGAHRAGYYYVPEDTTGSPSDISSMYSAQNMKINPDLLKQPTLLGFVKENGEVDQDKADALAGIFTTKFDTLNPNVTKMSTFTDYYSDLIGAIANEGSVYKNISKNQATTVKSVEEARQQVIGVSQDEELTNMIKYQNAYNASSRYINTIDEMLEHLLERLA